MWVPEDISGGKEIILSKLSYILVVRIKMFCKNRVLLYSKIFVRNFFEIVIDAKGIDVSQRIWP